jgi:hypothetical protein
VCPKASAARISAFVWQETGPRETLQMCRAPHSRYLRAGITISSRNI